MSLCTDGRTDGGEDPAGTAALRAALAAWLLRGASTQHPRGPARSRPRTTASPGGRPRRTSRRAPGRCRPAPTPDRSASAPRPRKPAPTALRAPGAAGRPGGPRCLPRRGSGSESRAAPRVAFFGRLRPGTLRGLPLTLVPWTRGGHGPAVLPHVLVLPLATAPPAAVRDVSSAGTSQSRGLAGRPPQGLGWSLVACAPSQLPGFAAVGRPSRGQGAHGHVGGVPFLVHCVCVCFQGLVVSASAVGAVCGRRRGLQQGGHLSTPSAASHLATCAKRLVFSDPGPGTSLCQAPGRCRKTRPERRCARRPRVSLLLLPQRGGRARPTCSRSACLH